jgi:hypothetical protein
MFWKVTSMPINRELGTSVAGIKVKSGFSIGGSPMATKNESFKKRQIGRTPACRLERIQVIEWLVR